MEKILDNLNFFVFDSQADFFDLDRGQAKKLLEKLEEKQDMTKKYYDVFEDMIQDRIECMNYDVEENNIYKTITEDEKKLIADKLIRKSDYMWDVIYETIDILVNDVIEERR